jgi:hypothetical protein
LTADAPLVESRPVCWLPWILRRASRSLLGDPTVLVDLELPEAGDVVRAALELLEEHDRLRPRPRRRAA